MTNIVNWYLDLDMSVFAERLKLLRQARSMTQSRLAELLAVNPRAYSRWERGDNVPHLETLVKIADILQVTLDELVGRTKEVSDPKIHNNELMSLYHQVDQLPDNEQQALVLVIDSFVRKAQVGKAMRGAAK